MELQAPSERSRGLLQGGATGGLGLQEEVEVTNATAKTESAIEEGDATAAALSSPKPALKSVKIAAGGAIDRIEFEYSDGTKWSLGGPGGNKGIPPLILAGDEYVEEVKHESLPQWWYVGSSIEFKTNKGRVFRHVAGWGSGEDEDMVVFRASPGKCIWQLRIVDGVLQNIIEGDCPVEEEAELTMYWVYWIADGGGGGGGSREVKCTKGHEMRQDWGRAGHICDECSRQGTVARCGGGCDYDLCEVCYRHHAEGWASAVQKKGFNNRDSALRYAARCGATNAGPIVCGPLRIELEDHPWLDACREVWAGCGCSSFAKNIRSIWRQARNGSSARATDEQTLRARLGASSSLEEGHMSRSSAVETRETNCAGIVVDVQRGTRVKAWGSAGRLSMCEKAASDAGDFNIRLWEKHSSSLKAYMDWMKRTAPLMLRVISLLDWRRNLRSSILVGLCILIRSVCDGWQPVLTGAVFNLINGDKHEVERESQFLHYLCSWTFGCTGRLPLARSVIFGLMFAAFVEGVAKAIGNSLRKSMQARQSAELRTAMFEHLLAQDQALFDTARRGELANKTEMKAMDQVTEWLWNLVADTVKLTTQLVFLFAISPMMTLIYTLLLPMLERLTRRYLERGLRAQHRREDGMQWTMHSVVHEATSMIKIVKTFSREDRHVGLVSAAARGAAGIGSSPKKKLVPRELRQGALSVFNDTSQRAVYCLCLWCGLVWMERDFSAGDMTAYLLLVQQVSGMVSRVRNHIRELSRRHDMLQDHFEFMDRTPKVVPGMHTEAVKGEIEFRDVEFSYPARPDVLVLKGVSFLMRQGEMTALVGASGSGKSTVASLLFRQYDADTGAILIDGVSLRDWDTDVLHERMALVAQSPMLFDTSIRNNLLYGCRREVSDAEVEEAAKMAFCHEFVQKFPAGYDTYVGDQGAQISGGQKQRLSIARAIILRPQILVLDEATSSLDAESEGVVQDALDKAMVGRTTLVIAHRLSTIKHAHQIVCMRDGQIVENDAPKALLAKQGYYWSLMRRQVCTLDDLSGFNLELDQKPTRTIESGCDEHSGAETNTDTLAAEAPAQDAATEESTIADGQLLGQHAPEFDESSIAVTELDEAVVDATREEAQPTLDQSASAVQDLTTDADLPNDMPPGASEELKCISATEDEKNT